MLNRTTLPRVDQGALLSRLGNAQPHAPVKHQFTYRVWMLLVDLDGSMRQRPMRGAAPRAPRLRALFLRGVPPRAPPLKALGHVGSSPGTASTCLGAVRSCVLFETLASTRHPRASSPLRNHAPRVLLQPGQFLLLPQRRRLPSHIERRPQHAVEREALLRIGRSRTTWRVRLRATQEPARFALPADAGQIPLARPPDCGTDRGDNALRPARPAGIHGQAVAARRAAHEACGVARLGPRPGAEPRHADARLSSGGAVILEGGTVSLSPARPG